MKKGCSSQGSLVKRCTWPGARAGPKKPYTSFHCNTRCDADISENLYGNVLLSTGMSTFQGIVERTTRELTVFVPSAVRIMRVHRFGVDWVGPLFDC